MPKNKENTETPNKPKTFSDYLKKFKYLIISIVVAGGAIWGVLESVYWFTKKYHEYELHVQQIEDLKDDIYEIKQNDTILSDKVQHHDHYIKSKRKSYQVGFRVRKLYDVETGQLIRVQKEWRDWDGVTHEVFKDRYYSEMYGYDYYFYIEKESGEKVYCIGNQNTE